MTRKRFAWKLALLALGVSVVSGTLALPRQAAAIELELPGERRMEIHGFYEMRLSVIGPELPAKGGTFSQFRHVLNFETENEIFPDGWGPFDFMMAYTRWIILYECIYERGCGLFKNVDSYGGANRSIRKHPRKLNHTRASRTWNGGVLQTEFRPRSLRVAEDHLNPGRFFRELNNGPGEVVNPNPFAGFANA